MKEEDKKTMRMTLIEISKGEHLCPTCRHFPEFGDTTVDMNSCVLFCKGEEEGTRYSDGNNRIYENGTVTKDNGGGYWVVRCPYYRHDTAWCVMLGLKS